MTKYSKKAADGANFIKAKLRLASRQQKVARVMHEYKEGKLKSGRSRRKVINRKQAIAIGLSEARKQGAKVPPSSKK